MTPLYDKALHHEKDKLFSRMNEQQSYFPELREKQALRIVEIGAGSGKKIIIYKNNSSCKMHFDVYLLFQAQI